MGLEKRCGNILTYSTRRCLNLITIHQRYRDRPPLHLSRPSLSHSLFLAIYLSHLRLPFSSPFVHSLPLSCNLRSSLSLPPSVSISLPLWHSIALIFHFSLSLVQSISSELLIYSISQCCIFSLPPRTVNFLPSLPLFHYTLLDRIRCYLSIKGPQRYLIKGL